MKDLLLQISLAKLITLCVFIWGDICLVWMAFNGIIETFHDYADDEPRPVRPVEPWPQPTTWKTEETTQPQTSNPPTSN